MSILVVLKGVIILIDHYRDLPTDLSLDDLTPIAVINNKGVIIWSNIQDIPDLYVGTCIRDVIPDLAVEKLFSRKSHIKTNLNGINYLISSYPSKDRKGVTLVLENYDIAKEQLNFYKKENELLHLMLNSPYEGMVFVDDQGVIRYVNNSMAKYNRMPREKIIGLKHEDFPIDNNLYRILKTQEYEPLAFYISDKNRKMIASRRPVYKDGKLAGVFGRYFSVDPQDVKKNFGESYIEVIARLQARDIMFNINQSVIELNSYKEENDKLPASSLGINSIIGVSPAIAELKQKILIVSESPSSVLLTGESGTGKELLAKAIHFHGNRSSRALVKVNCAAIPENLLEAELFGYADGAFTGARKGGKMGKFELANKGTIFLDEIGDMPLAMQAKLLRVLQEREIERVGSERTIPIDVRVISATNKDLAAMVKDGSFREDLFYRLNVVRIHIPPLRERMSDVPEIINHLINELNNRLGRTVMSVTPEAMELFLNYEWPGNVRELINVLEGAMNFCRSSVIGPEDLPFFLHSRKVEQNELEPDSLQTRLDSAERLQLISVLKQCNGNRKAAAAILEVSKTTMYRLMKKHKLL